MKFVFFFLTVTLCFASFSQKKIINHEAYDAWKSLSQTVISDDGKYSSYVISPLKGDGFLYLVNIETGKIDSFPRGETPAFTADNKSLIFKITPGYDTLRNCELKKVKKDKYPKDSLGVYLLEQDSLIKLPEIAGFNLPKEGNKVAYLATHNKMKVPVEEERKKKRKKKNKKKNKKKEGEPKEISSEGKLMVLANSDLSEPLVIKNVESYSFSPLGTKLVYQTHEKNKVDSNEIVVLDVAQQNKVLFQAKFPSIKQFNFDRKETQLALVISMDTVAKNKVYQLQYAQLLTKELRVLVDTLAGSMTDKQSVSANQRPYFSEDGERLYFGVGDKPEQEAKDSLLDSELAKLDLWHWKDSRLQPQQLLSLKRDERNSFLSVIDLASNEWLQLENDSLAIRHGANWKSDFALGYDKTAYEHTYNWDYPYKTDIYRVNMRTGEKRALAIGIRNGVDLSPSGAYYTYFNTSDQQLYMADANYSDEFTKPNCITCGEKANWLTDLNGMPMPDEPFGIVGWLKPTAGDKETEVLIQSQYDLYRYDIPTRTLTKLTNQRVKKPQIEYRLSQWERDSVYVDLNDVYLTGFNKVDKSSYLYLPSWDGTNLELTTVHHSDHSIRGVEKAKKAAQVQFRLSNLTDYPDLYTIKWARETALKKLSTTNPQQNEYNWATVELTSWKSYAGDSLQGLLYKPENYDPTKKYPLLVYFYELYSDDIHNHYTPRPTASIIYPTEYASAGYVVLIPDIRYKPGYPARGAYDCIMSATDHVLKIMPNIDSNRMGLQGQSWGGYQTAQLVTMTDRYAAAMAGAPVANMFSAYGGIRWGSGLNRQFQYERTQSRIGKTIWEAPELYVENSPIFHLPKVETPLLIMHNDHDGAVPWYQGIELFVGLKRLGKPSWLLNYNGDDHNLRQPANKMDLSIRMRQFFDYYLLNKPPPVWLIDGIPATEKGKQYRLEESK